jgi:glycosyltransferase involved in cell wall biosynthesis/SAM-dependent methyltransferase
MGTSDPYAASNTYFEQTEHWTQDLNPFTRNLMRKALEVVPSGVKSLLDIGCGAGDFCRMAAARGLTAFGLDLSFAALQQARGFPRLEGALPYLPFPDASFDLVTAFDVIEHLPKVGYQASLAEIFRVSRRWVLLIVPHAEDLHFFRHHCTACGNEFHENLHLRSLTFEGLCRDVEKAGGAAELLFFGEENWGYFDFLGARARSAVAGRWPEWDLAICPRCAVGERGPMPAGLQSILKGLEAGLHQEFQVHPGYWRRNRATEMGVLFLKKGSGGVSGTKLRQRLVMESATQWPSRDRVPGSVDLTRAQEVGGLAETRLSAGLSSGRRRVCLYSSSSDQAGLSHPVSLTAWPRSLICCASELQALPRPINYSAFSYLYREDQQWGEVVSAGERWARLFRPDMPGGHASFILSGSALFDRGFEIELFDENPGSFSVEIYDEGSSRYVPVGTFELTGNKEWKAQTFPVPSVLPSRWGYLCHLLPRSLSGNVPIASLGVGRAKTIASQLLVADTGFCWNLEGFNYPSGLFQGEQLVALLGEHDLSLRAVTLERDGGVSLILQAAFEWRRGTPLLLALGVFDALPVLLPDERRDTTERALFLALKGLSDQEGSRRLRAEEQTSIALDAISRRLADLEKGSTGATRAEVRTALEAIRSEAEQGKAKIRTALEATRSEIKTALEATRSEMRTAVEALRSNVEQVKDEVMTAVKVLRSKVGEVKSQVRRVSVELREKPVTVELSAELKGAIARLSGRKVFHGPSNLGGAPFRLAAAQRALGVQAASICYPSPLYRYTTDRNFEAPDALTRLSPEQLECYADQYDIFHFYFGTSLNGLYLDDVAMLKKLGKKVIFYFCGCDIKDPRIIRAKYSISGCAHCLPQLCNPNRIEALRLASELADLVYVSTPDLHEYVGDSRLLVQPVDVFALRNLAGAELGDSQARSSFVVAHSPTSRALKGTRFVIQAVERLKNQGLDLELRLIEGMSYQKALREYTSADLAVDQLLFGAYGQVAVEMMALGVPVVCYIREDVLPLYPEPPPIIVASPYNLAETLEYYYHHPEDLEPFRSQGLEYAARHHDTSVVARQTILDYASLYEPDARAASPPRVVPRPKRPRVVMLCDDYLVDRRIIREALALTSRGWDPVVVAFNAGRVEKAYWEEGVSVVHIREDSNVPLVKYYLGEDSPAATPDFVNSRLGRWVWGKLIRAGRWARSREFVPASLGRRHLKWAALALASPILAVLSPYWLLKKRKAKRQAVKLEHHEVLKGYVRSQIAESAVATVMYYEPDLIVAHDLPMLAPAALAAEMLAAPLVYDSHELYTEIHTLSPEVSAKLKEMESDLIRLPKAVFTVNEFIAAELATAYDVPEPRVLYNCTNLPQDWSPPYDNLRRELQLESNKKIVLFHGWFSSGRNLENLVEAFALLPNEYILVLLGFGDYGAPLLKRAKAKGSAGKVFLLDAVPQTEVLYYVASSDLGVIPYAPIDRNSYFCSPNKLFDFLLCQVPVLGYDSPFLSKTLTGQGVGVNRKLDTPQAFCEGILEALEPEKYASMKARLVEIGPRYDWMIEGEKFAEVIEEVVSKVQ